MTTVEAKGARSSGKGRETGAAGHEVEIHAQESGSGYAGTLTLPFATVQWRLPEFSMPIGRQEMEAAVHKVREALPPPTQLAYYAGLGVLAVFEIVEWPVVVVSAAGMIVLQRTIRRQVEQAKESDAMVGKEPDAMAAEHGKKPGTVVEHGKEPDATVSEKPAKPGKPSE
ncbi:hypothetical protein [Kutzneria kofuensis]|uniref:Uncharacterized protein n=1 Tax=Kutzneria kofuensis TaxID=103725 RepID=A0A7W9KC61_9PSEU|nr:hypothetical protein [Kutzneria kofuensis]MBB5889877.1 hypothetical protein [Kutzneria kofuensis]